MKSKINSENGKIILRISLSLVFIWFGINQLSALSSWALLIPQWASTIIPATTIVLLNALLELIFGVLLILGLYTRVSALVLSIHLFIILISMGYSPTSVRDFGLATATLAVFFLGPDKFCLDEKKKKAS